MRISHNIAALVAQNAGRIMRNEMSKSLERLSTSVRINKASDDAAGLSLSEKLRSQIRGLNQAETNASNGIGLLQIAEGAASEISEILQRMRELAVQSSNDTFTETERNYTDTEFQALMNEISRISKATAYNGMTLLDGGSGSFGVSGGAASVIHVGANNNNGIVGGSIDTMSINLDSLTLGAIGVTLTSESTSSTNITNQTNSFSAIDAIDGAIQSVNNMRADLGAYINRLDYATNNIFNQHYNIQDAESRIRDVDFARETTNLTKNQILIQSGTAMLAQANAVPESVFQLIR